NGSGLLFRTGGVHPDFVATFWPLPPAEREVVARDRHARLPFQMIGPIAEVIAVPRGLRLERRQAEPLPDCLGVLHELALGQRDRRERAFEHGIDQHSCGFTFVAWTARAVARGLGRPHMPV